MKDLRKDFPILNDFIYLDSAATSHKPKIVIDSVANFMLNSNATIRRGIYDASIKASEAFDKARNKIANFIKANPEEIIFTRGSTEALNAIAFSLCQALGGNLGLNSTKQSKSPLFRNHPIKIGITEMEHHANIVAWQIQASLINAQIIKIPINDRGEIVLEDLAKMIPDLDVLAITHMSNVLGTINPIKEISELAHKHNAIIVIDGAQGAAHGSVDVKDLDVDFYVFSGHKIYGPSGTGVLYGKKELLENMPPYHGGGDMIDKVSFEFTNYAQLPQKFEAGTPAIADIIGLGTAIDYLSAIDINQINKHEKSLLDYCQNELQQIPGLKILGQASNKAGIISFVFDDIEAFDIGCLLNQSRIAIRTGHHCAQPLMQKFGISGSSRISFGLYNNFEDIDKCLEAIKNAIKIFR